MIKLQIRVLFFLSLLLIGACSSSEYSAPEFHVSQKYHDYWSNGLAEINHYKLTQARYGELREGTAELIFVKEGFLWKEQVKSDNKSKLTAPVLKMNAVRKFQTGIYPYSILTSVFQPFCEHYEKGARKVSFSSQEWCGHVYTQMNHVGKQWFCLSHSYFATEGDQKTAINKKLTEDEIFTQIRLNPALIKEGKSKVVPSLTYIRLLHKRLEPLDANIEKRVNEDTAFISVNYPSINRTFEVAYTKSFPFQILQWKECYMSNIAGKDKEVMTKAVLSKSIREDYWNKTQVKDTAYYNELIR